MRKMNLKVVLPAAGSEGSAGDKKRKKEFKPSLIREGEGMFVELAYWGKIIDETQALTN